MLCNNEEIVFEFLRRSCRECHQVQHQWNRPEGAWIESNFGRGKELLQGDGQQKLNA